MKIYRPITHEELKFLLEATDFVNSITNPDDINIMNKDKKSFDITTGTMVRKLIASQSLTKDIKERIAAQMKVQEVRLCGCGCGQPIDAPKPDPDKTAREFVEGWMDKRDRMRKQRIEDAKSEQRENRLDAQYKQVLKQRKSVTKPSVGKYTKMIRTMYNAHPEGLGYMDIVELLYDGTLGRWSKGERHDRRGYGATNLCGSHRKPGILYKWFDKNVVTGKWVPRDRMRERVFHKAFQPFTQVRSRWTV